MEYLENILENLTGNDGKILIRIARNSITGNKIKIDNFPEKLNNMAGAFVTIYENNSLRGCIGYLRPVMPLKLAVEKAAWNAAYRDPRFEPVTGNELNILKLEVTVIGTLVPVEYKDIIKEKPGKFGIYIESGHDSGTLLPEVALKNNLSAEEFIQETCLKAGLDKDCYKYSKIYAYKVKVFNEK